MYNFIFIGGIKLGVTHSPPRLGKVKLHSLYAQKYRDTN